MHDSKRRSWVRRKTYIVAFAAIVATSASGTLLAGSGVVGVRGHVAGWEKLIPQVYAAASNDTHRYSWREPSPTVKSEFRKLSANPPKDLCVVAIGSAAAQAHEPLLVKVTGGRLTPATIVLSPGSRLSFKNADPFPHILYEAGNDTWAANPTAAGSTREWAATAPGLHVIRDQLFPSIAMYVFVDPNAVEFAQPNTEGGFSMAVAPGDYTFKVFFEGKPVGKALEGVHVGGGGLEIKDALNLGGAAGGGESK
jgi:hypothetical protein